MLKYNTGRAKEAGLIKGFTSRGSSLLLDVLAAWHGVPHARAGQDVHIVDNDKRLLLQRDDRQVVLVGVLVPVRVVPGPHREHQRQGSVLPAAHLQVTPTHMQIVIRDLRRGVFRLPLYKKHQCHFSLLGLSPTKVLHKGGRLIVFVTKLFQPRSDPLNGLQISTNLASESRLVKNVLKNKNENSRPFMVCKKRQKLPRREWP